jgi:CubicO group peptidase (beta-lactamase class C family)
MSLADSILQTASIARSVAVGVTHSNQMRFRAPGKTRWTDRSPGLAQRRKQGQIRSLLQPTRAQVRRVISAVFICLAASIPALAQQPGKGGAPPGWPAYTRTLDDFAKGDSVVGSGAVYLRDGRIVAHHEYGWADKAAKQRTEERTIYHWASITKTLTAIAIMQLRDRGKLSLDDRVTQYVPELRQVHDSFGSVDEITIRMLLSHSAGFQNPTWPYKEGRSWEPFEPTRWEQLVAMMPYQEIHFQPGSRFGYSNPAFIYLSRIIEQLTGDPYQSYIQKNIWTPLGLGWSYFGSTPYHLARWRSNNYTLRRDSSDGIRVQANGRDFDPGVTIPNSGWNAPLSDVARYLAFLSGAARGDTALARRYETVLKRSTLQEMWRVVVPSGSQDDIPGAVGLSFFLFRRGDSLLVGHTGDQAGFRSFFYLRPDTKAAVITVLNTTDEANADSAEAGWTRIKQAAMALLAP